MRPSERLTVSFLAALAALAAFGTPPDPISLAVLVALAAATAFLVRAEGGPLGVVRDFSPVAIVIAVFLVLEPVIAGVNPRRWDAFFAGWDARWLGALVPAWRGAFGRAAPVVDAVYLAYLSYYAFPLAAALLARRRGPEPFERAMFTILLCFYASYAGYVLFPTSGPRVPHADEARLLGGGAVSDLVRAFLRGAERTQLDAFPSGHTAITLVSLATGARAAPRAAPALLAWALAVVFSTVYIHVHYAADVVAGALLALLVAATADALARAIAPRAHPRVAL
ncbi:MAG TPA: phosphatase PAP2 family protein [Anaeromyxobacter sp.]